MQQSVFVYSNFNFSVKNAGVTRMLYYAQALANEDTSVYLVTCSNSPINEKAFEEIHPNLFILKDNQITQSFLGTLKYVRNLYQFSKHKGTTQSYLFYPSPLVFLELISLFYLKLLKKCSVFYELNEVRKYSSAFHQKTSIRKPIYAFKKLIYKSTFSFLELFLRYYDGLICISTSIENYGKSYNKSTIRIPILTNPDTKIECSYNNYSKSNAFNIGFSGSIQPDKENLLNFFEVLGKLKKNNFQFAFNLCGYLKKEHHQSLLIQASKAFNIIENVTYYGNLNAKELSTFLDQQELLVIPRGYTLQNNYGFSTKLSDYLNHSKIILVTDVSDNSLFIKDGENGFIVPTDDNDKMYDKIKYIIDNYKDIHARIQKEANKTSRQQFYYKNFSSLLSNFLFKINNPEKSSNHS